MNINIVLVRPSHPGNIGAAARAMKTMGLSQLSIVKPMVEVNNEAYSRATHAVDVLENCRVYSDIASAISKAQLVVGTSARSRNLSWPIIDSRELFDVCSDYAEVAILFGNERTGLTNQELSFCHKILHIATNPSCSALNLAAAVQIIAYELSNSRISKIEFSENATVEELDNLYNHLHDVIKQLSFIKATSSENILLKIKCMLQRCEPHSNEVAILRGLLTSIDRKIQ